VVISGSAGITNGLYYVLTSTNVARSLTSWALQSTNAFDGSAHFSFTNAMNSVSPQQFYIIKLPQL